MQLAIHSGMVGEKKNTPISEKCSQKHFFAKAIYHLLSSILSMVGNRGKKVTFEQKMLGQQLR